MIRQDESTQDMEQRQLQMLQKLRIELMGLQHQTERENQEEYNSRRQQELQRKHTLEQRQQPRNLKVSRGNCAPERSREERNLQFIHWHVHFNLDAGDADQETVPGHLQGAEQAVQGPAQPSAGGLTQRRPQVPPEGSEGGADPQAGHPGRAVRAEHQGDDGLPGGTDITAGWHRRFWLFFKKFILLFYIHCSPRCDWRQNRKPSARP